MNKERRKRIQEVASQIDLLKGEVEDILSEEEEYKENIPENMQSGERYDTAEAACDNLQSAVDCIEEALSCLEEAQN